MDILLASDRAVRDDLAGIRARLDALAVEVESLRAETVAATDPDGAERLWELLVTLVADEPGARRAVEAARRLPDHAAAWDDPDPLVSVCLPTTQRLDTLLGRSLPSVLAQTHRNLEVLVVGDAVDDAYLQAVRDVGDDRVRVLRTTYRVPYDDPHRRWLGGSVLPRNLAYEAARGRWLADLDDDDALRPDAVERLLDRARRDRLEVVYGRALVHHPDGSALPIGEFPPVLGQFNFQGSLVHSGLRWFARELACAVTDVPNDWERVDRMLRAGARVGMVPEITAELWPSHQWHFIAD